MTHEHEYKSCPHCGGLLEVQPLTGKEIVMNVVCAMMALIMMSLICRVADHWLTMELDRASDRIFWQERLFDWY